MAPRSRSMIVRLASRMTAPVVSSTVPLIAPETACANAKGDHSSNSAATNAPKHDLRFMNRVSADPANHIMISPVRGVLEYGIGHFIRYLNRATMATWQVPIARAQFPDCVLLRSYPEPCV